MLTRTLSCEACLRKHTVEAFENTNTYAPDIGLPFAVLPRKTGCYIDQPVTAVDAQQKQKVGHFALWTVCKRFLTEISGPTDAYSACTKGNDQGKNTLLLPIRPKTGTFKPSSQTADFPLPAHSHRLYLLWRYLSATPVPFWPRVSTPENPANKPPAILNLVLNPKS